MTGQLKIAFSRMNKHFALLARETRFHLRVESETQIIDFVVAAAAAVIVPAIIRDMFKYYNYIFQIIIYLK